MGHPPGPPGRGRRHGVRPGPGAGSAGRGRRTPGCRRRGRRRRVHGRDGGPRGPRGAPGRPRHPAGQRRSRRRSQHRRPRGPHGRRRRRRAHARPGLRTPADLRRPSGPGLAGRRDPTHTRRLRLRRELQRPPDPDPWRRPGLPASLRPDAVRVAGARHDVPGRRLLRRGAGHRRRGLRVHGAVPRRRARTAGRPGLRPRPRHGRAHRGAGAGPRPGVQPPLAQTACTTWPATARC